MAFDFAGSVGRVVLAVYRSKGARDAGLAYAYRQISWSFGQGTPARDANKVPLTTHDGGATWQNAAGQTVVPTYGPLPSVAQVEAILNNPLAGGLSPKALLYGIITGQPEIPTGATPLIDS